MEHVRGAGKGGGGKEGEQEVVDREAREAGGGEVRVESVEIVRVRRKADRGKVGQKERRAADKLKKQREDRYQRSQLERWVRNENAEDKDLRVERVETLASTFGETKKMKLEREKRQGAVTKILKEKIQRGSLIAQKRSLFERGEGGEKCVCVNLSHSHYPPSQSVWPSF